MRAGRDAVALVIAGWVEAGSMVRLEATFAPFAFAMTLRAASIRGDAARFATDDGLSEFVFSLDHARGFFFADIQNLHNPDPSLHDIVIIEYADQDRVSLAVTRAS